jgi:hypothetical protein
VGPLRRAAAEALKKLDAGAGPRHGRGTRSR